MQTLFIFPLLCALALSNSPYYYKDAYFDRFNDEQTCGEDWTNSVFLRENQAFKRDTVHFIPLSSTSANAADLVKKIRSCGWEASLVTGRVTRAEHFTPAMCFGHPCHCRVLETDVPDANATNYRRRRTAWDASAGLIERVGREIILPGALNELTDAMIDGIYDDKRCRCSNLDFEPLNLLRLDTRRE